MIDQQLPGVSQEAIHQHVSSRVSIILLRGGFFLARTPPESGQDGDSDVALSRLGLLAEESSFTRLPVHQRHAKTVTLVPVPVVHHVTAESAVSVVPRRKHPGMSIEGIKNIHLQQFCELVQRTTHPPACPPTHTRPARTRTQTFALMHEHTHSRMHAGMHTYTYLSLLLATSLKHNLKLLCAQACNICMHPTHCFMPGFVLWPPC